MRRSASSRPFGEQVDRVDLYCELVLDLKCPYLLFKVEIPARSFFTAGCDQRLGLRQLVIAGPLRIADRYNRPQCVGGTHFCFISAM